MDSDIRLFGKAAGEQVQLITLDNGTIACQIITYGAAICALYVNNKAHERTDIVLGYDTLQEYMQQDGYFGAAVGRYANRIANGRFTLNGKAYSLAKNDGNNHLHGGNVGFSHRIWQIKRVQSDKLELALYSSDGEEGYPGSLDIRIIYTLEGAALSIRYIAAADKDTLCNLTNHSYFNLAGHGSGSIAAQKLAVYADDYIPCDAENIPLGGIAPVADTPMDLRTPVSFGARLASDFAQIKQAHGFDHNFVIAPAAGQMRLAAQAWCEQTGIAMRVHTTLPGVQLYTANYIEPPRRGKGGCAYSKHGAFCLETQFFPDSPNRPDFPCAVLKTGEYFDNTTIYSFYTE